MKLFIVAIIASVATAAKLDNTYLPPSSARTAGGSGNFLSTPFQGSQFGSSLNGNFQKFSAGATPSANYGSLAPISRNYNQQIAAPAGTYGAPAIGQGRHGAPAAVYGVPEANGYRGSGAQASYYSAPVNILRFNNENNGDGTYQFDYETENKISQQEQGHLRNAGSNQESSVVQGSYSYAAPDGQVLTVNYLADENGFQPVGDHLPTPPPIPAEIQKSLQINAAAESASGYPSAPAYNGQQSGQYQSQQNGQYQGQQTGQYQGPQVSGQYSAPNRSNFNAQSGYRY